MAWRIEKQSNGRYAVFSTRLKDYVIIDAAEDEIERIYAEKGAKVYIASARAQIAKEIAVPEEGEALIEASRRRGSTPMEPPEPIGATGFMLEQVPGSGFRVPGIPGPGGTPQAPGSQEPAPVSIDAYLTRIGYTGSREPTPDTLRALHERHMLSVPFENLDIHWKRPIVVDEQRFLAKIVDERRGGFCYELNGSFAWLLRGLGFDVTMLSARVISADGTFGPAFDHMALLVRFADGTRRLADVGFGDSFLRPLDLDVRGDQHDPAGVFRIVEGHEWQMQVLRAGEWETQYLFTFEAHELPEYAPMCDHQQYSPQSHFTQRRVCTIATEWGRITLAEGKLVITRDGIKSETPVAAEEWDRVLSERFGIATPAAARG